MKQRNFVAKNAGINKAATFDDRKKKSKKGYKKHKKDLKGEKHD